MQKLAVVAFPFCGMSLTLGISLEFISQIINSTKFIQTSTYSRREQTALNRLLLEHSHLTQLSS